MKRYVAPILLFLNLVCCTTDEIDGGGGSSAPVDENGNIVFADATFKSFLTEKFDKDADGEISKDEALAVESIECIKLGIRSLSGIEYFTNLTYLDCNNNQIAELNVSRNTKLKELQASHNAFTGVTLGSNDKLEIMNIGYCQLSAIDLSGLPSLWYLGINGNQLTALDVSKNTKLQGLYCSSNKIGQLDVSHNPSLSALDCSSNQLTTLDVTNNPLLTLLTCSHAVSLKTLYVKSGQQISIVKDELTEIVYSGQASGGAISVSTAKISFSSAAEEQSFDIGSSSAWTVVSSDSWCSLSLKSGSGNAAVKVGVSTNKGNFRAATITVSSGKVSQTIIVAQRGAEVTDKTAITIPDAAFKAYLLKNFDTDGNGEISKAEASVVLEINVAGTEDNYSNVASLKGIEHFTRLMNLYCQYCKLTELDLSKNISLEALDCEYNQLTNLDLSHNTVLAGVRCRYNQLTKLDFTHNPAMLWLNCPYNYLTELNLSRCTRLTELYCAYNQLPTLDVSNSPALMELGCAENKLTSIDVSKNTNIVYLSCWNNDLKELDISNNPFVKELNCVHNYNMKYLYMKTGQTVGTMYKPAETTIVYK